MKKKLHFMNNGLLSGMCHLFTHILFNTHMPIMPSLGRNVVQIQGSVNYSGKYIQNSKFHPFSFSHGNIIGMGEKDIHKHLNYLKESYHIVAFTQSGTDCTWRQGLLTKECLLLLGRLLLTKSCVPLIGCRSSEACGLVCHGLHSRLEEK